MHVAIKHYSRRYANRKLKSAFIVQKLSVHNIPPFLETEGQCMSFFMLQQEHALTKLYVYFV